MRKITIILVVTFLGSLIVSSSQVNQTQEERFENQERPEPVRERNIELTITTVGPDERESNYVDQNTFIAGEQVRIAITMTNRMAERTVIGWGDVLFQTRVKLQRDGQEVAYLPDISDALTKLDRHEYQGNSRFIELLPNVPKQVSVLLLKNWYPPLEVGHYQLKVKHIFFGQGTPIHSNLATFDVVPPTNP
jgi:hypothetical protein